MPPAAAIVMRRLGVKSAHPIVVVESAGRPARRLLVKCRQTDHRRWQDTAVESRILTDVAPRIWHANPATRCPRLIRSYPDRDVLVMEWVEGELLSARLFGLRPRRQGATLRRLLASCGEWLGRFHALTRTDSTGDPFQPIADDLARPGVRHVLESAGPRGAADEMARLVDLFRRRHRDLRQPRCTVHGMFVPFHVLTMEERIYVFDLASCRAGYGWQDLATFIAFADAARPWFRIAGGLRVPLAEQRRAFLDAYAEHAGGLTDADRVLLHLGRALALVGFTQQRGRRRKGMRAVYRAMAERLQRRQLRAALGETMTALRALASTRPADR